MVQLQNYDFQNLQSEYQNAAKRSTFRFSRTLAQSLSSFMQTIFSKTVRVHKIDLGKVVLSRKSHIIMTLNESSEFVYNLTSWLKPGSVLNNKNALN